MDMLSNQVLSSKSTVKLDLRLNGNKISLKELNMYGYRFNDKISRLKAFLSNIFGLIYTRVVKKEINGKT